MSTRGVRLPAPPPRLLVAVAVAVLVVTTLLAVLGAYRTGITTDEPIHVMRLRNYFATGWYALDWDYTGAGPGSDGTNTFVYAPVAMLLLHAWSVLCGAEGWGQVSTSAHAYDVRHLGVVAIGLVGVAAVAVIGRIVLRHWRWGLVAAAILAVIPMWTGHEMFNVKDVPVATGHTLATLGLLCFVRSEPAGRLLALARAGTLVAGLVLTLGTRPGMWPGLLAVLAVAAAGVVLASSRRHDLVVALGGIAASCTVAAAVLVAVYPHLFAHPFIALPRTSESSSSFLGGEKSDRLYVPHHLAEEMPTLLLVFVVTGAVVAVTSLRHRWRTSPVDSTRVALVGVQAFTLPVVAIIVGADLYHGLRQLLFAVPAMAVLAAYGMAWVCEQARVARVGLLRRVRRLALPAAVAALALPLVDQLTLQPYQTTYVNLATDLVAGPFVAAGDRPGGDFWRVSLPELLDGVPLDRQLLCKSVVDKTTGLSFRFTNGGEAFSTNRSLDCREEPNGPLAPDRLPVVRRPPASEYDAVFLKTLPANCTPRNEVTRWRHGFEVVLSILGRCTAAAPTLTATGVRVTDSTLVSPTDDDIWRFATDGWQQWPRTLDLTSPVPQAAISFRAGGGCDRSGCVLVIDGDAPADLVANVDGTAVPVTRGTDGRLLIGIAAQDAGSSDGVWVTLTRTSGQSLGMRLTGLSLEAPSLARTTTPGGQR